MVRWLVLQDVEQSPPLGLLQELLVPAISDIF
jgi:hypothetical protein